MPAKTTHPIEMDDIPPFGPQALVKYAIMRIEAFCKYNNIVPPIVLEYGDKRRFPKDKQPAYYSDLTIHFCRELCPLPGRSTAHYLTNSWPGNYIDHSVYGTLLHNLGHHVDVLKSVRKSTYFGDYGQRLRKSVREPGINSSCYNDAEWFAEMFRLFVSNHALLMILRPRTWDAFMMEFTPISDDLWEKCLGPKVPKRVTVALQNLIAKKLKVE